MPAKPQPFSLCGPAYETADPLWNRQVCVNWYPSIDDSGTAQSKVQLSPVPGLAAFSSAGSGPIRGLWAGDNRLFTVSGGGVYEIAAGGGVTSFGSVLDAETPVQIAADGNALMIASGDEVWYVPGEGSNTMAHEGISVVYLDSYWIILLPDSNVFLFSMNGLDWTEAEGDATLRSGTIDRAIKLETHEGHLWIFGRQSIVPYYNSGDANTPWMPIPGAAMDTGTIAPWSICKIDQRLYWLGTDAQGQGRVFRTQGYTPVRISNQAIEHLIAEILQAGVDEKITGSGYTENGHTFYVLSFPLAGRTLVFDLDTNMWHERRSWTGSAWSFWKGSSFHVHVFGKHLTANITSNAVYEQSASFGSEAGATIRRYRAAPYVQAEQQWLFHHYLRLLVNGDTAVNMRYQSDDQTAWSTTRTVTPFRNEVEYRRLGRARDRLYEVWVTDSSAKPTSILEAWVHAGPGTQR